MRILIVNAYGPLDYSQFATFQNTIMKCFSEQRELIDTENEFFVRDRESIEDFLYEIESSYIKKESANKFDQIDIIFLTGDANYKPWSVPMKRIMTLLRMCMKVNKLLFTASFGTQALVYLAASNIEKPINIINGQGGGNISDIKTIHLRMAKKIQQNDFFLDNTTGDLYGYNYESSEWLPKANIGLHYRKAAQEFQSIGKYIVKAPIYKPKDTIHQTGLLYKNKNTETICELKKTNYHHWVHYILNPKKAFQDLQTKFLTPLLNSWDVHTFSFINLDKAFSSLAESDEGPAVIEFKTFLGCVFEIDPRYAETPKILKNFILHSLRFIKTVKSHDDYQSIAKHHAMIKESSLSEQLKTQHDRKMRKTLQIMQSRPQIGIIQTNTQYEEDHVQRVVKHVGFSLKKSQVPEVVAINSVWDKKFKVPDRVSLFWNASDLRSEPTLTSKNIMPSISSSNHRMLSQHSSPQHRVEEPLDLIDTVSQTDVRNFLHPQMSEGCLRNSSLWVPGNYSKRTSAHKKLTKQSMVAWNTRDQLKQYASLAQQEPYMSKEDTERAISKKYDKKMMGAQAFKVHTKSTTSANVVYSPLDIVDEFMPPEVSFRKGDRKKWLFDNFIV